MLRLVAALFGHAVSQHRRWVLEAFSLPSCPAPSDDMLGSRMAEEEKKIHGGGRTWICRAFVDGKECGTEQFTSGKCSHVAEIKLDFQVGNQVETFST